MANYFTGEGGPPIGPDGEPLAPGDFGPDGPTPCEQDAAAREAFETALAAGLSPEEAMAEAAEAAGFPAPPGGFGGILYATAGGADFAGDGPFGGPGDFGGPGGPGGPGDFGGPGGPGDFGGPGVPGGPGDFGGPGGPAL